MCLSVSVCLYVCPLANLTNHMSKLHIFSVYVAFFSGIAIRYVLPVLCMDDVISARSGDGIGDANRARRLARGTARI